MKNTAYWFKRVRLGAASLCIVLLAGIGTKSDAASLADALVGAYNHSGLIEQNRALLRAADEDVAIAGASLRPIINWTANVTRQWGENTTASDLSVSAARTTAAAALNATLQLYDGGADRARVAAREELVMATRAALLNVEQQVLLRAAGAYFNVIRQQEFVALTRNNLRLLQEEERAAQDRFDVGEVTRTDVALAQAAVASARSNLASAERNLVQAQAEYTNVVGRAPGRLAGLSRLPQVETNIAQAQALAVRVHPEMRQAQRQVAAADLLVQAARLDMNPTISVTGRLGTSGRIGTSEQNDIASIELGASGPIYQGGALYASERRAIAEVQAARSGLHTVRHDVQQGVVNAISNLEAARASLAASERQIRAARVAFQGVREEATLGARTTLDVLDAEQNLLDAETNRIAAQADQYIAAYSVLEAQGQLTAELLRLPVQLYDPEAYFNTIQNAPLKRSRQGRDLDRIIEALGKE